MDFSHYYHSKVKSSVDEDRAAVVAGFNEIISRGIPHTFRLITYYKGLPISYPAIVMELKSGVLHLEVHQQQVVALERSRRTFIKCDYFDSALMAEVQQTDIRRKTASLKNFAFVNIMAERRENLRLELDPPTVAEISLCGQRLPGQLCDISLGGFSISPVDRCPVGQGEEVRLQVQIPNLLQNTLTGIKTPALHLETIKESANELCRFSFQADQESETTISRFIFQRQVELIRELKEAC